jgi:hypothetical protein
MISRYQRDTWYSSELLQTLSNYYEKYGAFDSSRAAHSSNSYPNAVDIRTKIIGITLTTHRITTENQ